MATNFDDYLRERQKSWTPEQWAIYDASSQMFAEEASQVQERLEAGVTDERIQAWADEAEAGYSVEDLLRRRGETPEAG